MKNKERFKDELAELALNDQCIAVTKYGELTNCGAIDCNDCMFFNYEEHGYSIKKKCAAKEDVKKWAEEEYKEPITAERLREEFNQMCKKVSWCSECNYYAPNCDDVCRYAWLLEHYNVTEKENNNGRV